MNTDSQTKLGGCPSSPPSMAAVAAPPGEGERAGRFCNIREASGLLQSWGISGQSLLTSSPTRLTEWNGGPCGRPSWVGRGGARGGPSRTGNTRPTRHGNIQQPTLNAQLPMFRDAGIAVTTMPQSARCAGIVCRAATNSTLAGSPSISADIRQYPTIELWSDAGWATIGHHGKGNYL